MPWFEWLAFIGFLSILGGYSWLVEVSPWSKFTLSRTMAKTRRRWFEESAKREMRMPDVQILTLLQTGAAYFGSASLLGIGAGFTLFTTSDALHDLDLIGDSTALPVKALLLMLIYALAFFQFSWSFRVFGYNAIALGAICSSTDDRAVEQSRRAAALNVVAGQHFNQAIRLFMYAIPLVFWVVSLWAMLAATILLTAIMLRRQFFTVAHLDGLALAWNIDQKR